MRKTVYVLDSISQWSGRVVCGFCFALVLLLNFEVFMRYVLNAPTAFSYEIASMIGVTIGSGGLAYTHLHGGHVRVDIFWRLLSPRRAAIADIIGSLLFFFPFTILVTWVCVEWAQYSVSVGEVMKASYLHPPAWPVRIIMALAFFIFIPQGVSKFIRDVYQARGIELKGISKV